MTILRRYYDLGPAASAIAAGIGMTPGEQPELIVTFDTTSGELITGWRPASWAPFSPPLALLRDEDDPAPSPGDRTYAGTDTHDVLNQAGEVVASVAHDVWHDAGTLDPSGETFVAVPPPAEESEESRQGPL